MDPNDLNRILCEFSRDEAINQLAPEQARMMKAHQLGHIIDHLAGPISTRGLEDELQGVYNTLNNPNRTADKLDASPEAERFRPEDRGFMGEAVAREYIAEAIRAYLTDPNYLKTVAPRTAAAIRAAVNPNPRVNTIIQFN
jgi:hypothetical protein